MNIIKNQWDKIKETPPGTLIKYAGLVAAVGIGFWVYVGNRPQSQTMAAQTQQVDPDVTYATADPSVMQALSNQARKGEGVSQEVQELRDVIERERAEKAQQAAEFEAFKQKMEQDNNARMAALQRRMEMMAAQNQMAQQPEQPQVQMQPEIDPGPQRQQIVWEGIMPYPEPQPDDTVEVEPNVLILAGSVAPFVMGPGVSGQANSKAPLRTVLEIGDIQSSNGTGVPSKQCRIVADVIPNEARARIDVEGITLTCVLPSGKPISQDISGWGTALDNINGIPAEVIHNDLGVLKEFLKAGGLAMLADAIGAASDSAEVSSVFGTISVESGSEAADQIFGSMADFFLERADPLKYPTLVTRPKQIGFFFFAETVELNATLSDFEAKAQEVNRAAYN